jgi:hypothetical protein
MMARYSKAVWLPIPENTTQADIKPTQFILHSMSAPWNEKRLQEFWNQRGISTESHFGVDYDGSIGQYMDTLVRADANTSANRTALSVETASNVGSTDKWTPAQVSTLIALMGWVYQTHKDIPARICRNATDPGFGLHNMFPEWSGGGTTCPGKARVKQFHDEIWPAFLGYIGALGDKMPTLPPKPTLALSSVQYGKTNSNVRMLQVALINKDLSIPAGPTGYFGDQTEAAYKKWQERCGFRGDAADGAPGKQSLGLLFPGYQII